HRNAKPSISQLWSSRFPSPSACSWAASTSYSRSCSGSYSGYRAAEVFSSVVDQMTMTDSGNGAAGEDRKWYVIHTYSGYENKVKTNLEHRIESMGVQDKIFQVVIPTEEEIEIKDGQRRTVQKKVYPGYVMVEMAMDDDAWYVVRNTPGVTGFVGTTTRPSPLQDDEVKKILKKIGQEPP